MLSALLAVCLGDATAAAQATTVPCDRDRGVEPGTTGAPNLSLKQARAFMRDNEHKWEEYLMQSDYTRDLLREVLWDGEDASDDHNDGIVPCPVPRRD
jgi:hypothetical protein